jgi:hypothetical protein
MHLRQRNQDLVEANARDEEEALRLIFATKSDGDWRDDLELNKPLNVSQP